MSEHNPWLTSANEEADEEAEPTEPVPPSLRTTGPNAPQPGVNAPADRLPRLKHPSSTPLWWLGVHGGSGESTLEKLFPSSRAAGHAWPDVANNVELPRVILVARTHARGLRAAQTAATEWASGSAGVDVLGLVLIADAPGRLPRPLKEFAKVVSGGVPRVWRLPWIDSWRLGEEPTLETSPRAVRALVSDLAALLPSQSPDWG